MRVKELSRLCDAIYRYGSILFIIENKMNIHHEQHGLEYIGDEIMLNMFLNICIQMKKVY